MKHRISPITAVLVCGLGLGLSNTVFSQAVLEEIIVTAQKREQSLLDVPISVNVVGGEYIANFDINRAEDLMTQVPNLIITEAISSDRISLRGISSGFNLGFEQSVGTFIDGIYHGRDYQSRGRFLDIERIEVLRGPQSTYFGNNTIAGALSVTTRKPGDTFEGFINASFNPGDEADKNIEVAVGGPVTDTFGLRGAVKWDDYDGFIENRILNVKEDRRTTLIGRLIGVWQPTDAFELMFKAELSENEQRGRAKEVFDCPPPPSSGRVGPACFLILAQQGPPLFLTPPGSEIDGFTERGSIGGQGVGTLPDFVDLNTELYQLNLDYDVFGHTLTSITAFSGYDAVRSTDVDAGPSSFLHLFDTADFEQWSQELRLSSPTDGRFEYLVGFYYQSGNFIVDEQLNLSTLAPQQQDTFFDQDAETISPFGSLTWNVTDAFRGTVGLRYTRVEKDLMRSLDIVDPATRAPLPGLEGTFPLGAFPHPLTAYSRSDDDWTPSINLQYDLTEDAMVYASYAEGFKAGGFDQRSTVGDPDAITFAPESVDAYEIGAKTSWFDDALNVSLTAFRSEYTDLQISLSTGVGVFFFVDNAAGATTQGLELDTRWAVTDRLTLGLAAAYLDTEYDEFPLGPCDHFDILNRAPGCPFPGQDFAGNELPYSPKWSGNFNLDHVYAFGNNWTLTSNLTVQFTDEYFTRVSLDPRGVQDGFVKLDARVALGKDKWDLAVIGKNLTDEDTGIYTPLPTSTSSGTLQRHRERYFLLQGIYAW